MTNRPARGVRVGIVMLLSGAFGMVAPSALGMDGMSGGYGIAMLAGVVALSGLITWIIYAGLARRFARILAGEGRLAHWTYTPDEWRAYTIAEYGDVRAEKGGLYITVMGIATVVLGGFAVVVPGSLIIMACLFVGLALVLGIAAFASSRVGHARNRTATGQAIISRLGALLPAEEHFWGIYGSRIRQVSVEDGAPPVLRVVYTAPDQTGGSEHAVRIPIPADREDEARRVAEALRRPDDDPA